MARPLRVELSGGLYHVTSRGDRREDIYFSEADREAWLALFAQVCARFNWIVTVQTPSGIAGRAGKGNPWRAAAMTVPRNCHEDVLRRRQVSMTLARRA